MISLATLRSFAPSKPLTDKLKAIRDEDYEELKDILKNGLPKNGLPKKKIIIVGAGMAGLTAAKLLVDAGHEVTVLEASDCVGGRVRTYRSEDGWYADLGPMRIPSSQEIFNELIDQLPTVEMNPFLEVNDNTFYLVNGKRHITSEVKQDPNILNYTLAPDEGGKSAEQLLKRALQKVWDEVEHHGIDGMVTKYGHYSVKQYLVNESGLSPGAIKMIGDILDEASLFYASLTDMIYEQAIINDKTTYSEVKGGFDKLPKALYEEVKRGGADFRFKATVKRIVHLSVGVTVYADVGSCPTTWPADFVLVTATAKATLFIDFQPPLPLKKTYAMRQVHYDSATKIFLTFKEKFWEKGNHPINGGRSVTDLPIRFIYYPSHSFEKNKDIGVLLASYTWSDDSYLFLGKSDEELKEMALSCLMKIHGDDRIKDLCTGVVVQKWSQDQHSLGAFAIFTPFQHKEFADELFRKVGTVYFAGEHTALPHAWIETAMKSAIRAARNIHTVTVGGWGQPMNADVAVQNISDVMKSDVERKTGKNYKVFQAILYRTQTVTGTNYLIKVHVGGADYVHILVFDGVCDGEKPSLEGVQTGKTRHDPLDLFPQ